MCRTPHAIDGLLLPGEAARQLHVSRRTITDWVRKGWIVPAVVTPGDHTRFTQAEVDRVLAGMKRGLPANP